MAIGATVRRLFGPLEGPVTDLYRSFFVDLGRQLNQVKRWVPTATNILEIGCGEGAIVERLLILYPMANIVGIDISSKAGRLFRGDRARVRFACATAAEYATSHPREFDLVLACDVLHHVPWIQHESLLADARAMLMPGGAFVLKDWELIRNVGHTLCEASDRVLTGDGVRFGNEAYFHDLLDRAFGSGSVRDRARVRPWRNNLLFHCRPSVHEIARDSTAGATVGRAISGPLPPLAAGVHGTARVFE